MSPSHTDFSLKSKVILSPLTECSPNIVHDRPNMPTIT